jgi:hypothetical protein
MGIYALACPQPEILPARLGLRGSELESWVVNLQGEHVGGVFAGACAFSADSARSDARAREQTSAQQIEQQADPHALTLTPPRAPLKSRPGAPRLTHGRFVSPDRPFYPTHCPSWLRIGAPTRRQRRFTHTLQLTDP